MAPAADDSPRESEPLLAYRALEAPIVEDEGIFADCLGCFYAFSECLTEKEKAALRRYKKKASVQYDPQSPEHEALLCKYFRLAFHLPDDVDVPEKADQWKELGFQNGDPRSDFRGGGLLSLQCMIYFAHKYSHHFETLMRESNRDYAARRARDPASSSYGMNGRGDSQDGTGGDHQQQRRQEGEPWEYPLSAVFVNITHFLVLYLKLNHAPGHNPAVGSDTASKKCLKAFARLALDERDCALEELFCCAAIRIHRLWKIKSLSPSTTLTDFPEVMQNTKRAIVGLFSRRPDHVLEFHQLFDTVAAAA
ncbi:unnamed protein product [Vitrella brassicaformis CCMP3155]|uniref:ELMO domain-containing protein n=1 Tax=Vitrella brassicaformis (strain CCMP3155) TaxID=1169540 RepID=A0A0G4E963_VITBC|nr:unnamed protein product [Vitrella brassicaformis CCMP3155]|eukprot:CEL92100.1 unnamed protein product [Vitrella brassicaformis CCMP3155]